MSIGDPVSRVCPGPSLPIQRSTAGCRPGSRHRDPIGEARQGARAGSGNPFFWGGYGFVSYMITGEQRPYQADQANFGRVLPADPFLGGAGGRGAFEVAFRVSYLDLEDRDIEGGRLLDLTWGFNWYATETVRVLTNIIWADPRTVAGSSWIAQVRLQWAL